MAYYDCPFLGCNYNTGERTEDIALLLLTIHGRSHATPAIQPTAGSSTTGILPDKTEKIKIKMPTISVGCTTEQWAYFKSRWATYKKLTKLAEPDVTAYLLQCCDTELHMALYRANANLEAESEGVALAAIKKLAVRAEKEIVARVRLLSMKQDRDEPVRTFVTKLQGQASTCKYVKSHKCHTCEVMLEVNYADDIVRDVLARGLADTDIQIDLLGITEQDMSLEETVQFIEAKETGKQSASNLSDKHTAGAVRSTYKRNTTQVPSQVNRPSGNYQNTRNAVSLCYHCGKPGAHKTRTERMNHCPAWNHICKICTKHHHFESVCFGPQRQNASAITTNQEGMWINPIDGSDYAHPVINNTFGRQ